MEWPNIQLVPTAPQKGLIGCQEDCFTSSTKSGEISQALTRLLLIIRSYASSPSCTSHAPFGISEIRCISVFSLRPPT